MSDDLFMKQCVVIGGLIPKLSKIYDGLEELDIINKVDEIRSDYDKIMTDNESSHLVKVQFNVTPFTEQIKMVTDKLNELVDAETGVTVEHVFVMGKGMDFDATSNIAIIILNIGLKWEVIEDEAI